MVPPARRLTALAVWVDERNDSITPGSRYDTLGLRFRLGDMQNDRTRTGHRADDLLHWRDDRTSRPS